MALIGRLVVLVGQLSWWQLCKFGIVGGVGTGLYYGLLYGLTEYAHVWYLESSIVASIAHFVLKFFLLKFWAFEDRDLARVHHQLGYFFGLSVLNFGLNTLGLYVLVQYFHLWYLEAQVILTILLPIEVLVASCWIFKKRISV
ncbi:MAG: GtrA family protein [bacterium]|nr:GtrA family protein [bacterium]